ncbi:hypothetical protein POM88_031056 [Heracleum sosnowskyi]|uniref:Uncharacterized protein n=1 Tax=Heracleum sosnowskyi TaxID=360622 RepID=A0AAD8HYR0_9APIA|nr:hypothetical protein POM88_031056 [Heracleum sosnowskyi]
MKLLPPKSRRMPGRPKKHRRREADEIGAGSRMSKKGIAMTCSRCLKIGHNKATCKTSEAETTVDNSSHGQGQSKKRGRPVQKNHDNPQAPCTQEATTETAQKKKIGRPPKASNTQVQTRKKPSVLELQYKTQQSGVGVLIGDDGHTYLSSSTSTIRLISSQPCTPTQTAEELQRQSSSSQPMTSSNLSSPLKKGNKQVFPRSELKK